MSGKKHVFKMLPGQSLRDGTKLKVFQGSVDGEELTCNNFNKVWLIPLDDEDDTLLDLPIKFCYIHPNGSSLLTQCTRENGENLEKRIYICDSRSGKNLYCRDFILNSGDAALGYENNAHSFVYLNEKLVKISSNYKVRDKKYVSFSLKVQPVEYQYVTREESDDIYKYYFSDDQGNIIDSPDNDALQYIERHVREEVIQDILSSKIPEDIILSKAFTKVFVKNLTENQLETLVNTLNDEQLKVLANNLTDNQLQTLAQELNPEKLHIIVPLLGQDHFASLVKDLNPEQVKEILPHLKVDQFKALIKTLNDEQFTVLAKDLAEHHLTILSKELEGDQLKVLVNSLQRDQLKDLVNKLDHEKLETIAQGFTDPNRIQMIIESLADNPEKLQAFAHKMPDQQFTKLLDQLNAKVIKNIIHNLPYEKVKALIGDQDQSKALIDTLKGKIEEHSKQNNEMIEMLRQIKDDMPDIGQAPDFTIVDINNDSLLFV